MNFFMFMAILLSLILVCLLVAAFVSYKTHQAKTPNSKANLKAPVSQQPVEPTDSSLTSPEQNPTGETKVIDIPPNPASMDSFNASYLDTSSYVNEKTKAELELELKPQAVSQPIKPDVEEVTEDTVITLTPDDIKAHYERKQKDNGGNFYSPLMSYKDYIEGDNDDISFYYRGSLFQIENIEKKVVNGSEEKYIKVPLFGIDNNLVNEDDFINVLQDLKSDSDNEHSLLKHMKGDINPFNQERRTYLTSIEKNKVAQELGVKIDFVDEITKDHRFFIEIMQLKSGNFKVMALPSDNLNNWSLHYSVNNSFVGKETFLSLMKKDKDLLLKKTIFAKRFKFNSEEMRDIRASARAFYQGEVEKGLSTKEQANKDFLESMKLIEEMQSDPLFWVMDAEVLGIELKAVNKRLYPDDESNWGVLYYINNKSVSRQRFEGVCIEIFNKVPLEFLEI